MGATPVLFLDFGDQFFKCGDTLILMRQFLYTGLGIGHCVLQVLAQLGGLFQVCLEHVAAFLGSRKPLLQGAEFSVHLTCAGLGVGKLASYRLKFFGDARKHIADNQRAFPAGLRGVLFDIRTHLGLRLSLNALAHLAETKAPLMKSV